MTKANEVVATNNRVDATHSATEGGGEMRPRPRSGTTSTAQIIALPELHAHSDDAAPRLDAGGPILRDWNPLHQIKARLQVCVGEATLSVGELLAAKEQQLLRLDRATDQAVDLMIEGKVIARGQLVAVDGHFGIRITELPAPLGLAAGA